MEMLSHHYYHHVNIIIIRLLIQDTIIGHTKHTKTLPKLNITSEIILRAISGHYSPHISPYKVQIEPAIQL